MVMFLCPRRVLPVRELLLLKETSVQGRRLITPDCDAKGTEWSCFYVPGEFWPSGSYYSSRRHQYKVDG